MSATELTLREQQQFENAELEIARCIAAVEQEWVNLGKALAAIRDGKLYRVEFGTFEAYLKDREINKRTAYRAMKGVALIEYIEAEDKSDQFGHFLKESHTREVEDLPQKQAAEVIKVAVDTAPPKNGKPKVTAEHVRKTREEVAPKPKRTPKAKEVNPGKSVDAAIKQHYSPLCRIIDDIAEQCGWKRKTPRVGYHKAANDALNDLSAALKEMRKGDLGA